MLSTHFKNISLFSPSPVLKKIRRLLPYRARKMSTNRRGGQQHKISIQNSETIGFDRLFFKRRLSSAYYFCLNVFCFADILSTSSASNYYQKTPVFLFHFLPLQCPPRPPLSLWAQTRLCHSPSLTLSYLGSWAGIFNQCSAGHNSF